jgi:hypothetical protein
MTPLFNSEPAGMEFANLLSGGFEDQTLNAARPLKLCRLHLPMNVVGNKKGLPQGRPFF